MTEQIAKQCRFLYTTRFHTGRYTNDHIEIRIFRELILLRLRLCIAVAVACGETVGVGLSPGEGVGDGAIGGGLSLGRRGEACGDG